MGKIPPKNRKKGVKTSKITSRNAKIYTQIRKICKKYPKIRQKIKNIKDLDKRLYYAMVWEVTEQQPLHILENSDKRGWKNHHLDHICSISVGYYNNIPPELIGDIKNLQFIYYKENIDKGCKVEPHILKEMIKKSKKY
jgi:predicted transcriptional regulator